MQISSTLQGQIIKAELAVAKREIHWVQLNSLQTEHMTPQHSSLIAISCLNPRSIFCKISINLESWSLEKYAQPAEHTRTRVRTNLLLQPWFIEPLPGRWLTFYNRLLKLQICLVGWFFSTKQIITTPATKIQASRVNDCHWKPDLSCCHRAVWSPGLFLPSQGYIISHMLLLLAGVLSSLQKHPRTTYWFTRCSAPSGSLPLGEVPALPQTSSVSLGRCIHPGI